MDTILVRGGAPLSGTVETSGSKNAALPILCATLLNEQAVTLHNVPDLEDVRVSCGVLESLGAAARRQASGALRVDASQIASTRPPYELVNRMRASFLALGPLLARFGEADVPLPGGCEIGARPVGEHLAVMTALGASIEQEAGVIKARATRLKGAEIYLNMVSVGATENALMAASLADGASVIHNAALEPEVTDLCHFLERCGVDIEGAGTKSITVHGQPRISAAVDYSVIPDRIEAGTYLTALAGTGGEGVVTGARPEHLEALLFKLRECGVNLDHGPDWISIAPARSLRACNITTDVHPGFPTDLMPQMSTVLTRAEGNSTIVETVFENRLKHVSELIRMGARITQFGNTATIGGMAAAGLTGAPVEAHDIRCAAALVVAGLMAQGDTQISGLRYLLRGYERMPEKMAALGGSVKFALSDTRVASEIG